jgi:hypothetical protein
MTKQQKKNLQFSQLIELLASTPDVLTSSLGLNKWPVKNGTFNSFPLTRRHYYQHAGMFKARERTAKWNLDVQDELLELSFESSKGVDLERHISYKNVYLKNFDNLWFEYLKPRWARQRLRLYGGKKRVFATYFNNIKNFDKTKRVVIAFGSAKFVPGGRGEISVPTSRAFKECQMTFPTIVVDEFRTTRIHHEDNSILEYIKRRDTNSELRGLLWCSSPNNNKFVNRDLNAATVGNIRRCAMHLTRPSILQRSPNNVKLQKVVGKFIKC